MMQKISQHSIWLGLVLLVSLGLLISCNGKDSASDNFTGNSTEKSVENSEQHSNEAGAQVAEVTEQPQGTPSTRVYHGVAGSVEIPTNPRRIVADYYVGEVLKLQAPLVGADLTWATDVWQGAEEVADVGQSFEAIMGLNPDLIITMNADFVEQYNAIAPTVLIPYGAYNPEELMLVLGDILGKTDIAEAWINSFEASTAALAELVPSLDETYTIIDTWGGNAYLYGEHYGRGGYILYNKLGLFGTAQGESDYIRQPDSYLNVTIEALPLYAGDVILVMSNEDPEVASQFFTNNVVWEGLSAVQRGKVLYLDSTEFWFTDPFSLDRQVELLAEIFTEATL